MSVCQSERDRPCRGLAPFSEHLRLSGEREVRVTRRVHHLYSGVSERERHGAHRRFWSHRRRAIAAEQRDAGAEVAVLRGEREHAGTGHQWGAHLATGREGLHFLFTDNTLSHL